MFDNVCIEEMKADEPPLPSKCPVGKVAPVLYADVLSAVSKAEHITAGVRANMKSAVTKIALRVSAAGLQGPVAIPVLQAEFERLTPAMLGLKRDASLAAFKSNLRAALRLTGIDVMPGRDVTALTPGWARLIDRFEGNRTHIKLSRFAHVASQQGWEPDEICTGHLERFRVILDETNIGSKAAKVVRGTITAWSYGRAHIAGWPAADLGRPLAQTHFYTLRWADFPENFRRDVETYLERTHRSFLGQLREFANSGAASFLTEPKWRDRAHGLLREKTKQNDRGAFLRAASILVRTRQPASNITGIASLVGVEDDDPSCDAGVPR